MLSINVDEFVQAAASTDRVKNTSTDDANRQLKFRFNMTDIKK